MPEQTDVRILRPKTIVSCTFFVALLFNFQNIVAGIMAKLASAKVLNASDLVSLIFDVEWREHPLASCKRSVARHDMWINASSVDSLIPKKFRRGALSKGQDGARDGNKRGKDNRDRPQVDPLPPKLCQVDNGEQQSRNGDLSCGNA